MVGITSLPQDVLRYLNNFLGIREQFYFKNLNRFTREALNMKDRVEKTFKISGLESVADNEPELAGVMRLAWTSHDPFLFFAGLLVDFISGKKPYKVINRPLLLHLVRNFPTYEQKCGILKQSEFLAIMCSRKGQFDLVFELFRGYPDLLKNREIFGQFENRDFLIEMIEMLGTNRPNTLHYLNALLIDERNPNPDLIKNVCGQLIAECIINDLPQSYYEEIFDFNPEYLEFLFNELIISTNVPESEYARIYALLTNIFEKYSSALANIPNFTIIRMIIDVRFGSFELQNLNFEALGDKLKSLLIKAALLANKNFLFLCAERDLDRILEFQNLNVNDVQAKSFKVVFEMIQSNPDKFKNESHSLFHFVMKFYAVKNLKLKGDFIYYDFVASENLLEFGFPPGLQIKWRRSTDGRIMEFIQLDMKVLNETAINTFIPDLIEYYENHFIRGTPLYTSYEFIEFISTFRNILLFLLEYGIKLEISSDFSLEKLEKYLDLDNFDLTTSMIHLFLFN
jgi:hypothetical protein